MLPEPDITINGVMLTSSQSMAVRVAIQSFISDLVHNGLGDDEKGKALTSAYLSRLQEVNMVI